MERGVERSVVWFPASWGVGGGEFPAGAEEWASVCLASFTSCMRCASPRRVSACLASPPVDMPARCRLPAGRGGERGVVCPRVLCVLVWRIVCRVCGVGRVVVGAARRVVVLPRLALPRRVVLRVVASRRRAASCLALPRCESESVSCCLAASPAGRGVEITGAAVRPVPSPSEFFPAHNMGGGGCGLRACAPRACLPAASSACGFVSFG